jgi:hypothetical protein
VIDEKFIRRVMGLEPGATVDEVNGAYIALFSGPNGEIVLEDLAKLCGAFSTSIVAGDTQGTGFNEGQRNIFDVILQKSLMKFSDKKQETAEYEGPKLTS